MTTNLETTQKPTMKVVLNGGSAIMDSATIPIRWFFNKETIEKKPNYILIIDHSEKDFDEAYVEGKIVNREPGSNKGSRYIVKVDEAVFFLPVRSPGRHHLSFIAIEVNSREKLKDFLKKNRSYCYGIYMSDINHLENGRKYNFLLPDINSISATTVEINVPAELFSRKPETILSKAIWQWVNRWHETEPVDQCQYRKRMIWAFTAQPIFILISRIFSFWATLLYTSLLVILRILVFYIGFRPKGLFAGFKFFWTNWFWEAAFEAPNSAGRVFERFDFWVSDKMSDLNEYRCWKNRCNKDMVATPLGLSLIGFATWALVHDFHEAFATWEWLIFLLFNTLLIGTIIARIVKWKPWKFNPILMSTVSLVWLYLAHGDSVARGASIVGNNMLILMMVFGIILVIFSIIKLNKSKVVRNIMSDYRIRQYEKELRQREKITNTAEIYKNWLSEKLSIEQAPEKVILKDVPAAPTTSRRIVQKFKVEFGTLKAKVCKPFAR